MSLLTSPDRRSILTICLVMGGDRRYGCKGKVAQTDSDCQEGRGVITLSLSNSFARKDFNSYTLAGLGNSTSARKTLRPATPGCSAVSQPASPTEPFRPNISQRA